MVRKRSTPTYPASITRHAKVNVRAASRHLGPCKARLKAFTNSRHHLYAQQGHDRRSLIDQDLGRKDLAVCLDSRVRSSREFDKFGSLLSSAAPSFDRLAGSLVNEEVRSDMPSCERGVDIPRGIADDDVDVLEAVCEPACCSGFMGLRGRLSFALLDLFLFLDLFLPIMSGCQCEDVRIGCACENVRIMLSCKDCGLMQNSRQVCGGAATKPMFALRHNATFQRKVSNIVEGCTCTIG